MTRVPLLFLLLTSCAETTPIPDVKIVCLPLTNYTLAQQAALSKELKQLAPDSTVNEFIIDYERMRDADRACLSSTPGDIK